MAERRALARRRLLARDMVSGPASRELIVADELEEETAEDMVRQREAAVALAQRVLREPPTREVVERRPDVVERRRNSDLEEIEELAKRAIISKRGRERQDARLLDLTIGACLGVLLFACMTLLKKQQWAFSGGGHALVLDCDLSYSSGYAASDCGVARSSLNRFVTACGQTDLAVKADTAWSFRQRSKDFIPNRQREQGFCRKDDEDRALVSEVAVTTSSLLGSTAFSFALKNASTGLLSLDLDRARLSGLVFDANRGEDGPSSWLCNCEIRWL